MKIKFLIVFILITVLFSNGLYAFSKVCSEDTDLHPIEVKVTKCIKDCDYATACTAGCINASDVEWQKEIDKNLSELKNKMSENEFYFLQKSQFEWEQYRKAQERLDEKTLGTMLGSMYLVVLATRRIEVLSNRAKELEILNRYLSDK